MKLFFKTAFQLNHITDRGGEMFALVKKIIEISAENERQIIYQESIQYFRLPNEQVKGRTLKFQIV